VTEEETIKFVGWQCLDSKKNATYCNAHIREWKNYVVYDSENYIGYLNMYVFNV